MAPLRLVALGFLALAAALPARAQCIGEVAERLPLHRAALSPEEVRVTFVGHATFLIESPQGIKVATDYNDYVRPRALPDIATMNHAHDTHYSRAPDPAIRQVLRGWDPAGGVPRHDVRLGDVRVRNVPTNIRDLGGGTEQAGNSIFVIEVANLCIAHLGHLHHTLTPQRLGELGRIDVVLAAVDGSWTIDLDGMMEVLDQIKPQLVVPMHYFGRGTLDRFLDKARGRFEVQEQTSPTATLSRATLPAKPTVLVLPGR